MTKPEIFMKDLYESMVATKAIDDNRTFDEMWAQESEADKNRALDFSRSMIEKEWNKR